MHVRPEMGVSDGSPGEREGGPQEYHAEDECSDLKGNVDTLGQRLAWLRVGFRLRLLVSLVILVGIISYIIGLYLAATSIEVTDKRLAGFSTGEGPDEYIASVGITLLNPTDTTLTASHLRYRAYLEGDFIGEGAKDAFEIPHGEKELLFDVIFDTNDLQGPTATLFFENSAELTVEGDVGVPIKAFGLLTFYDLVLPYSISEQVNGTGVGSIGDGIPPLPVVLHDPTIDLAGDITLEWSQSISIDFRAYELHASMVDGFDPGPDTLVDTISSRGDTTTLLTELPRGLNHFLVVILDEEGYSTASNQVSQLVP